MNENRCVQLATIQRNAAGKALVADVTAKNLFASTVDVLRIVKARCRRCAPLCPGVPLGPPRVPPKCSSGTPQHARAVLHTIARMHPHEKTVRSSQAALKKQDEVAARKRQEEDAAKKKQAEEAAKKRAAEEAARKKEQEVRPHKAAWLRFAACHVPNV